MRFRLVGCTAVGVAALVASSGLRGTTEDASPETIRATRASHLQAGSTALLSQLVWFDRSGSRLGTLGPVANHGNIEFSPDGRRVAVTVLDTTLGTRNIWLYDVTSGERTRFTTSDADENWAIWSRDGREIIFNSSRNGGLDLFRASVREGSTPQLLLEDGMWPVSWAPDGRHILFVVNVPDTPERPGTANDVLVLPLFGDREPYPFARTQMRLQTGLRNPSSIAISENWAAFSPNGRWVVYSSTETGRAEVYVAPFPPTTSGLAAKQRVSADGGSQARWSRDGREIFYVAQNGSLMVTAVNGDGATFEAGAVERLFEPRLYFFDSHGFDVAADGRILVNTLVVSPAAPSTVAE